MTSQINVQITRLETRVLEIDERINALKRMAQDYSYQLRYESSQLQSCVRSNPDTADVSCEANYDSVNETKAALDDIATSLEILAQQKKLILAELRSIRQAEPN